VRSHVTLGKEIAALGKEQAKALIDLDSSQAARSDRLAAEFQTQALALGGRVSAMEKAQSDFFQQISSDMAGRLNEVTKEVRTELEKTAAGLRAQAETLGGQFAELRKAQEEVFTKLRTDMTARMDGLMTDMRAEFGRTATAMTEQANALGVQFAELRKAQEQVFAQTRTEMTAKMDGLLTEMRTEFGKTTAEMTAQTKALGSQVDTLRKTQEDLFPQVRAEMSRKVDGVLREVQDALLKTGREQTVATAVAIQDQAGESLQRLVEVAEETYGIVEGKLIQNEERSRQSRTAGAATAAAGDYEMARLYYVNAFNHSPSDPAALGDLCTLVSERFPEDATVLEQTAAVVDVALYQLPADAVPQAIQNRQAIMKLQEALVARNAEPPFDPQAELRAIDQTPLDRIAEDSGKLKLRIQGLNALVEACNEAGGETAGTIAAQAQSEAFTASSLLAIAEVLSQTDRYLALVEKQPVQDEQSAKRVSNLLMAASSAFSAVWQFDMTSLPQAVQARINATEGRLNAAAGSVSRSLSKIQEGKVTALLVGIRCDQSVVSGEGLGAWQKLINAAESAYRRASEESVRVTDEETRKPLPDKFVAAGEEIAKMRRKQYLAYQTWATAQIKTLFDSYQGTWVFTDKAAKDFFQSSQVPKVDVALLTPEVSRAYEKAMQYYLGEVKAPAAFGFMEKLIASEKTRLEDF
jgi:tetratricopeptide (TPR) repeat protein